MELGAEIVICLFYPFHDRKAKVVIEFTLHQGPRARNRSATVVKDDF